MWFVIYEKLRQLLTFLKKETKKNCWKNCTKAVRANETKTNYGLFPCKMYKSYMQFMHSLQFRRDIKIGCIGETSKTLLKCNLLCVHCAQCEDRQMPILWTKSPFTYRKLHINCFSRSPCARIFMAFRKRNRWQCWRHIIEFSNDGNFFLN